LRKPSKDDPVSDSHSDEDASETETDCENPAEVLIRSRKLLRDPSSTPSPAKPKIDTDQLLESLHRSLRQQLAVSPLLSAQAGTSSAASPLSGAMAKNVGRTHEKPRKDKTKSGSRKKKAVPPEVARSLSRIRELLAASKAIGIDQPKAREDLKWGELALDASEFKVAATCFRKVDRQAKETLSAKLPEVLKHSRESLKRLEKHRGETRETKALLDEAKNALENGQYADTMHSINEAAKKIRDSEQEIVLKIMFKAKERFLLARKVGLNIDRPLDLLRVSREKLKIGKFEEAIKHAEEGERIVEAMLKREHRGKRHLAECMRAIRIAELLGAVTTELDDALNAAMALFKTDELDKALESSKNLTAMAKKAAYDRAASTYEMAERGLGVAKNLGLEIPVAEETLKKARQNLEKDELVKSYSLSTSVIVDTNTTIMDSLNDKLKNIGQFAKGIEGEVMSLTEVQDAIEHSKERSIENFRKYAQLSEELVHQAFESAISYTRVSQDVVKQAFNSSVAVNGGKVSAEGELAGKGEVSAEIVASAGTSPEDKRLRIINLYLDGKITESQLERLLTLIDSSVVKVNLV